MTIPLPSSTLLLSWKTARIISLMFLANDNRTWIALTTRTVTAVSSPRPTEPPPSLAAGVTYTPASNYFGADLVHIIRSATIMGGNGLSGQ